MLTRTTPRHPLSLASSSFSPGPPLAVDLPPLSSFLRLALFLTVFRKILGAGPPLSDYFPDYTGPPREVEPAKAYMRAKFVALNPRQGRGLYVHLTCATDSSQARVVLAAVMDQVLTRLLSEVGLM